MFRNDDNILNAIHEQKESHLKLVKEMGELGSTVKKILAYLENLSTTQTELITLSSAQLRLVPMDTALIVCMRPTIIHWII